jgi:2,3-diketo-5-methylthio-1-phosphopentane phosphatase/methylthioribulose-1-phosphate dehydratase
MVAYASSNDTNADEKRHHELAGQHPRTRAEPAPAGHGAWAAVIRALLLDIEGTTSSLEFVREVLFPHAREHLGRFIEEHRGRPEVDAELAEVEQLARTEGVHGEDALVSLRRWMAEDRKLGPLKALQGLLWEREFQRGSFAAHIYPDVPAALALWRAQGLGLHIYSSGSVRAQRAFFRYSTAGDLTPLIDGYFDTSVGGKLEPESYRAIARQLGLPPAAIAFLSDSPAELDAARSAGLETIGVRREPLALGTHRAVAHFDSLPLELARRGSTPRGAADEAELARNKTQVVALSRHCHARGWAQATSGNFSVRAGSERMVITASGVDKGALTERDVLLVGFDLRALEPGNPSAEAPLHAALYRGSPQVRAVLHTHSVAATVLSRLAAGAGALRLSGYEMTKAVAPLAGGAPAELVLPVLPNQQDTLALAQVASERLARSAAPAYLVEGHGLTTWGESVEQARHRTEALEFLLACELEAARSR